jgi:hypothetical protein
LVRLCAFRARHRPHPDTDHRLVLAREFALTAIRVTAPGNKAAAQFDKT